MNIEDAIMVGRMRLGKVEMDSELIYERKLGHWTFVWVYRKSIRENQAEEIHVAAIDPGVRTFLTWYSPTVGHGNIGDNDINRIFRLCLALDALISHAPPEHSKFGG